jgi:hypothetical protein
MGLEILNIGDDMIINTETAVSSISNKVMQLHLLQESSASPSPYPERFFWEKKGDTSPPAPPHPQHLTDGLPDHLVRGGLMGSDVIFMWIILFHNNVTLALLCYF